MADPVSQFSIQVEQVNDYEFRVRFDKESHPDLKLDEPPPLGKDEGPSASRLLAAAVGNCLAASFLFAARKQGLAPGGIRADVSLDIVRNEKRRLRIGGVHVTLHPGLDAAADAEKVRAAVTMFEDFCTVTASIRQGIPVDVTVAGA
jgi:uncharacterized OsmC-like protein